MSESSRNGSQEKLTIKVFSKLSKPFDTSDTAVSVEVIPMDKEASGYSREVFVALPS